MKKRTATKIDPETGEEEEFEYEVPENEDEAEEIAEKRRRGEINTEPADLAFSPEDEEPPAD